MPSIEFARVLRASSPNPTFALLSGSGADPTGRSRMAFARYKSEAEKAFAAAGFSHVYIFRSAYIYPVQPRRKPDFSYRLLRAIYSALGHEHNPVGLVPDRFAGRQTLLCW
jgi:uncharacterized protein YbjT (DUF2867 family)